MAREGGVSGINPKAYFFATFPLILKNYLKGPGPLKIKKTIMSGKTTSQGASLNQGACGVKNR
jgi:hypothetical protein